MISALYQKLTLNKNTTNYIKEKWESELNIEISDKDWLNMWKMHQTTTNSRTWREFSWKNLVRFFITPKVKSNYLSVNLPCWRECGALSSDHSHVFWNCDKVQLFWKMVHKILQEVLRYKIPLCCKVLYLCNFTEENVHAGDRYLVKILLIAGKKAITRKWGRADLPTQENWMEIIEEIYVMEKLTHRLRLQETQLEDKWLKWTFFRTRISDKDYWTNISYRGRNWENHWMNRKKCNSQRDCLVYLFCLFFVFVFFAF